MKALVLDLEEDILDLLEYNFTKAGFEVWGTGEEAKVMPLAEMCQPDLVVIGNCSSPQTQQQLCEQIRSLDRVRSRPASVICLSTHLDHADQGCVCQAANLCLPTPIKPKELIQLIKAHMSQPQLL
jgi:DNA-binding response OmpR family regulator